MSTLTNFTVYALLVPALLFASGPIAWGQAVGQDATVVSTASSDDDGYEDEILIGLFVVVVSILVILGIRSDREYRSEKEKRVEYAYHDADEADELAPVYADIVENEDETEGGWQVTGLGLRATF
jgi:hypothetical protein